MQSADATRYVKNIHRKIAATSVELPRCELDSHADTCVAGNNTLLVSHNDQKVTVNAYSDELKSIRNILIATVATLYEDPQTGDMYILIIHQALYFGDRLNSSLLNPNQLRHAGLVVDDVPRQFDSKSTHSIYLPHDKVRIPLTLEGVISGFESRKPTWKEYNDADIPHFEITSDAPWMPASANFAEKEMTVARVSQVPESVIDARDIMLCRQISSAITYRQAYAALERFDDDLGTLLQETVMISALDHEGDGLVDRDDRTLTTADPDIRSVSALVSNERSSTLTPEILSQRWNIGLAAAKRTMVATTQAGLRNVLAPSERRIRQRMSHLKYPTLKDDSIPTRCSLRLNR